MLSAHTAPTFLCFIGYDTCLKLLFTSHDERTYFEDSSNAHYIVNGSLKEGVINQSHAAATLTIMVIGSNQTLPKQIFFPENKLYQTQ